MTLEETLAQIKPLDKNSNGCLPQNDWDEYCETPTHSLGKIGKLGDSDCGKSPAIRI